MVLHMLVLKFPKDTRQEDKTFWIEWQQEFPEVNVLLFLP
jgi:hypothetical protein